MLAKGEQRGSSELVLPWIRNVKGQEDGPVSTRESGWEEPTTRLGVLLYIFTPSTQEAQAGSL